MMAKGQCGEGLDGGAASEARGGANSPWSGIDAEGCYRYTLSRQSREGGFCYFRYAEWGVEQANAPDTYAALVIFRILGRPVPAVERCAAWLKSLQDSHGGYPTLVIAHSTLNALQLLGQIPSRDPRQFIRAASDALTRTSSRGYDFGGWLASALRCIDLWKSYEMQEIAHLRNMVSVALRRLLHDDGGYGAPGADLVQTWMATSLSNALGLLVNRETLNYAQRCEEPPYGFNITPSARSSSLECQLAGVRLLRRFGLGPKNPARVRAYVARCQTSTGGFGRAPGAIPRLGDSQQALEILAMLPHT